MNAKLIGRFLAEMDEILDEFQPNTKMTWDEKQFYVSRFNSIIERTSRGLSYEKDSRQIMASSRVDEQCAYLFHVVRAIRNYLDKGYFANITQLIHAEIFADFLEMARHLHEEGYKDASAVIAGGALESHLRVLCHKWNVKIEYTNQSGELLAKKADRLNSDLAKVEAYSKGDQKAVTAWLDIRNSAAHLKHDLYRSDQVGLMIDGIGNFVIRNPA
jgi:hypothetical protein